MIEFNKNHLDTFLGVVRKYMQVRGGLNQKDLAELVETGVSTMSRFLNQKTQETDPQLVARIVAKLEVPLHEIIDFIEEESTDKFKKLVQFYRDDHSEEELPRETPFEMPQKEEGLEEALSSTLGTAKKSAKATVKIGGRKTTIPFNAEGDSPLKEKLERLSPRQKAYLSDFLNLDVEARDLLVDLGNSMIRYFRQKGAEI